MRILIVIHTLPRYSLGGSELCAESLAAELGKRHRVHLCAGRPADASTLPRQELGRGYVIEWLDADPSRPPTLDAAYRNAAIEAQFQAVMARVRPDVVHFHGIWGLSNQLPLLAREGGAAVVFTLHDFWLMCPRGQRLRPTDLSQCGDIELDRCSACLKPWIAPPRWPSSTHVARVFARDRPSMLTILARAQARLLRPPDAESLVSHVERYHATTRDVFAAVDLFVSPSRFLAREFERYGLPRDRILYSPNGIDTAPFAACAVRDAPAVVRFGFMGSWMPSKGLHVLIEAFRGLTENARLLVFGGAPAGDPGEYARGIQVAADDRRITFAGRVSREQVASVFAAIDVLVVPSLWYENAPLTIQEAFASRTPVIASRSGGMAEAVRDGVDGLLFAPGSVADLRTTLRTLAREPDLVPALGRQTPPVTTLEEHASALEAEFHRLMARAPADDTECHAHTARRS